MIFIYGVRLLADISFFLFFASLITRSWILVLVLTVGYTGYMIFAKKLYTSWDRQVDFFSLSWKLFLGFGVVAFLIGKTDVMLSYGIPLAICSLSSSVLLLRMLRHGPDVYLSKQYQLKSSVLLVCTLGVAWVFSSGFVRRGLAQTLSFIYMKLILPILNLLLSIFVWIVSIVLKLLSWMNLHEISPEESQLGGGSTINPFANTDADYIGQSGSAELVLTIIGAIVLVVCAYFLFRWLSSSEKIQQIGLGGTVLSRNDNPEVKHERSTSLAHQVRKQYRKFLKLYKFSGGQISTSDTSADIMAKSVRQFPPETVAEIREIYIRARYNNQATKEDLKKLRQMNQNLRQNS